MNEPMDKPSEIPEWFREWARKTLSIPDDTRKYELICLEETKNMWLAYLKGRDDRPVVKIIKGKYGDNMCENCGVCINETGTPYNLHASYCPNCGARLDWSENG